MIIYAPSLNFVIAISLHFVIPTYCTACACPSCVWPVLLHIVFSLSGWVEPLLDRIGRDSSAVVCPVIDVLDDSSLEFHFRDSSGVNVGGFDWNLQVGGRSTPTTLFTVFSLMYCFYFFFTLVFVYYLISFSILKTFNGYTYFLFYVFTYLPLVLYLILYCSFNFHCKSCFSFFFKFSACSVLFPLVPILLLNTVHL